MEQQNVEIIINNNTFNSYCNCHSFKCYSGKNIQRNDATMIRNIISCLDNALTAQQRPLGRSQQAAAEVHFKMNEILREKLTLTSVCSAIND